MTGVQTCALPILATLGVVVGSVTTPSVASTAKSEFTTVSSLSPTSERSSVRPTIAAALCSLKGPKHGGANIKVVEMMADLKKHVRNKSDEEEISAYLLSLLRGQGFDRKGLIYGMGHTVYSISDPRATIFKGFVKKLAEEKGRRKIGRASCRERV